jgi:V/A-type H+-transporting ATPase subunit C
MDFGYINARVRAWKGDLFSETKYNEFLAIDSLEGFIGKLKGTSYGFDLEEARARFRGKDGITIVEKGLKGNLIRTFRKIWDESPSDARILIKAILSFWDIYNLKTIIRGIHRGVSPDELYSILIPAGDFDESALRELTQLRDIRLLVQVLDTWGSPYGRPLKECLSGYLKNKEIIGIELALDRFVYSFYLPMLKGKNFNVSLVKELVKDRIDVSNIFTLFKFVPSLHALTFGKGDNDKGDLLVKSQSSYPVLEYYVPGGKRLTEKDFIELSRCKDMNELFSGLIVKMKEEKWKEMLRMVDPTDLSMLEVEMEDLIGRGFCNKAVTNPLSIAVIVCFYFRKIREIKNLRLIGRGKESLIPVKEIKRYLRMGYGL